MFKPHVDITKVKSQDEKPKHQTFTLGHTFYEKMGIFNGIFGESLVDYV